MRAPPTLLMASGFVVLAACSGPGPECKALQVTLPPQTSAAPIGAPAPKAVALVEISRKEVCPTLYLAIEEGIRLLEWHDERAFLVRFVAPPDAAELDRYGGIERLLEEFQGDRAALLLEALKKARAMTPKRKGKRLIFDLEGMPSLSFEQFGRKWFINA